MSDTLFFSIIIPVYNRIDLLDIAIQSILRQGFHNYEIIVVDDGSKDDILKVISKYPNIIYVSQKNAGQGVARNKGVNIAKGEYLCFLDSDDSWEEHYLEHLYSVIISEKNASYELFFAQAKYNDLITQESWFTYDRNPFYEKKVTNYLLKNNFLVLSGVSVKRKLLGDIFRFSEDQTYRGTVEDYRLWIELSLITDFKYIGTNKDNQGYVVYNIHSGNDSGNFFRSIKGLITLKLELLFSSKFSLFQKYIIIRSLLVYYCLFLYKKIFLLGKK